MLLPENDRKILLEQLASRIENVKTFIGLIRLYSQDNMCRAVVPTLDDPQSLESLAGYYKTHYNYWGFLETIVEDIEKMMVKEYRTKFMGNILPKTDSLVPIQTPEQFETLQENFILLTDEEKKELFRVGKGKRADTAYQHSQKQEQKVARELIGRVTKRSGAGTQKGDLVTSSLVVECKATEKESYSLKFDDWEKLERHANEKGKDIAYQLEKVDRMGNVLERLAVIKVRTFDKLFSNRKDGVEIKTVPTRNKSISIKFGEINTPEVDRIMFIKHISSINNECKGVYVVLNYDTFKKAHNENS